MYAKELINLSSKLDKIGYYGIASNIDQLRLGQVEGLAAEGEAVVKTVGPVAEQVGLGLKNLFSPAAKATEEAAPVATAVELAGETEAGKNLATTESAVAENIKKAPSLFRLKDPEKWRGLKVLGGCLSLLLFGGLVFSGDKKVDPATATDVKAPTVDADGTIADLPVSKETWQKLFIDKETNNGLMAHSVLEDLKADRSNTSDKKIHRVSDAGIMSVASWIIESFENKFAPGHEDLMKKELIYIQTKMGKISGEILQSDVEKAVQIAQIQGNTPQFIQYIRDNLKVTNPSDPRNIK